MVERSGTASILLVKVLAKGSAVPRVSSSFKLLVGGCQPRSPNVEDKLFNRPRLQLCWCQPVSLRKGNYPPNQKQNEYAQRRSNGISNRATP